MILASSSDSVLRAVFIGSAGLSVACFTGVVVELARNRTMRKAATDTHRAAMYIVTTLFEGRAGLDRAIASAETSLNRFAERPDDRKKDAEHQQAYLERVTQELDHVYNRIMDLSVEQLRYLGPAQESDLLALITLFRNTERLDRSLARGYGSR